MAIQGVDTKCYILALFVRDDGERFLLGSGHYEFKDTQMHFAANAIQNDIVEVQGNDGFLLAGQVRRPGSQSFDGYVGDGTMSKEETESYRRQFFSFFRKNFFYKVIYVFSDGTAIQRKSGFLVDDPTVEELYQMYPEYHVALNFEDVNYYSYSEDEEGQEQYAKEATIDTSSMRATGGLVWDNLGVVWEATQWGGEQTASGTEMTIQNDMSVMSRVDDIRLDGDTLQNGTPTPDISIPVQVVTGEQKVTISDGVSFQSYGINLGKNLLPITMTNQTLNDVSFTVNEDKSIKMFGTATARTEPRIYQSGSGVPRITLKSGVTYHNCMQEAFYFYSGSYRAVQPNGDYTPSTDETISYAYIRVENGTTVDKTIYPMIIEGSTTTSYAPYFTPIELCKIGTYQDYIYKSGDNWYVHKETGKIVLDGAETWQLDNITTGYTRGVFNSGLNFAARDGYCNMLTVRTGSHGAYEYIFFQETSVTGAIYMQIKTSRLSANTLTAFKNWLSLHNATGYYTLATPTDTKITDATLVEQLDALGAMRLFIGENNLIVQSTGTNLPAPLSFKYYTTVAMTGAEWEEGGSGGATVVEVDSITNTYPIWRVKGPAVDPQLSVINTNTTIRYTGTVTSTQTLEIDMFNKTAKLNGVSVIGNVSGDWVSLAPGTNRVIYTAENADAQPSTIEWQEVVG